MHVNDIPTVIGQEYYKNRQPKLKIADKLKEEFEKNFQPIQENAVRDAMIKAAVKVGLVLALPKHPVTGIAIGAGPIAQVMQKHFENIKCPSVDTELFHAMLMMPTCQESKEVILAGLKGTQVPSKLVNEVTEVISQYLIRGADRAGITENNIKYIAAVAHRIITKTAPATAKRIYKQWVESPLAEVKERLKKPLLNAEGQKKFNEQIMNFLASEGIVAKSRFRLLESEFGQVFENQQEILENLKEAHSFFEAYKNQQIKRFQEAEYQRKIQQLSSIFSNLSHAGTQLKMPVLCDIAAVGNISLSVTTAFSALSKVTGSALSLDFAVPCFTLASAVISAISLFCQDDDDNSCQFNQMMIQHFTAISQQIATLQREMHGRFDEVDKKLVAIHSTLEKGITLLRRDINDFAVPTLTSLQDIRSSIFSLYRTVNFKLDETLLHDFEEVIDKIDNYVQRIQNHALDEKEYAQTLRLLEKVILKQSSSPTFNGTLYTDMSPQGINRLLMTKQVGHILGFLGLYAQEVLSIRNPKVDVYHLCNPYIWSTCVSRYVKFRKMYPEQAYDEKGLKMREILNAGKDILNYFNFISNRQDLINSTFASYKDSVKKLKDFCHLQANHHIKQHLKQIGFTSSQKDFISQKPMMCVADKMDNSFLSQQVVLPRYATERYGGGESLPIDPLLKKLKIPNEFLLAKQLGLGEIEVSYVYKSTRTQAANPIVYSFQIHCDFIQPVISFGDGGRFDLNQFTSNIYRKQGMDGFLQAAQPRDEYSIPQAWSLGTLGEQTDDAHLEITKQKILKRIQNHFLEMRKDFASSLLGHPQNAVTTQFNTLLEDVESKYKLLLALAELTGRKNGMQPQFAKLMNERKIREGIQQYSQSASFQDFFILEEFVKESESLTMEIAEKATEKATDPNYIEQVKKQYVKLSNFSELFLQQRALKEAFDIGAQPIPSTKDEDDSEVKEASSKEAMNRSAKKIKDLKQNIVELKVEMSEMRKAMAILQNQNLQILQFLQASSRPPKT